MNRRAPVLLLANYVGLGCLVLMPYDKDTKTLWHAVTPIPVGLQTFLVYSVPLNLLIINTWHAWHAWHAKKGIAPNAYAYA